MKHAFLATLLFVLPVSALADEPIHVGSRRELFVDDYLVDRLLGKAELRLHHPTPREVVLVHDAPWEGNSGMAIATACTIAPGG